MLPERAFDLRQERARTARSRSRHSTCAGSEREPHAPGAGIRLAPGASENCTLPEHVFDSLRERAITSRSRIPCPTCSGSEQEHHARLRKAAATFLVNTVMMRATTKITNPTINLKLKGLATQEG